MSYTDTVPPGRCRLCSYLPRCGKKGHFYHIIPALHGGESRVVWCEDQEGFWPELPTFGRAMEETGESSSHREPPGGPTP